MRQAFSITSDSPRPSRKGQTGAHQEAEEIYRAARIHRQCARRTLPLVDRPVCPVALLPTFVVEVCYDHFTGERFRHGTRLIRWRPDKAPRQCRFDQVLQKKANLMTLLDRAA